MNAYITTIGERTTGVCKWSLERNGFNVFVLDGTTTLAQKLKLIYSIADDDFIRVDADVIPNNTFSPDFIRATAPKHVWWVQFMTYDWLQQNTTHGGIQYIKKDALATLRNNIDRFLEADRPESQMYRLEEFSNPRRCISNAKVLGLHGYGQEDYERVKQVKSRRKYQFDWELFERVQSL